MQLIWGLFVLFYACILQLSVRRCWAPLRNALASFDDDDDDDDERLQADRLSWKQYHIAPTSPVGLYIS